MVDYWKGVYVTETVSTGSAERTQAGSWTR